MRYVNCAYLPSYDSAVLFVPTTRTTPRPRPRRRQERTSTRVSLRLESYGGSPFNSAVVAVPTLEGCLAPLHPQDRQHRGGLRRGFASHQPDDDCRRMPSPYAQLPSDLPQPLVDRSRLPPGDYENPARPANRMAPMMFCDEAPLAADSGANRYFSPERDR